MLPSRARTDLDTRDIISYFANHARGIIFRPRIPGACRRDTACDSPNAAGRAPDVWRDRESFRFQLADRLPAPCCASGCGSRRRRTSRTGDSIRAEHIGLPGLSAAPAGVDAPEERCSAPHLKGGSHPPTGGVNGKDSVHHVLGHFRRLRSGCLCALLAAACRDPTFLDRTPWRHHLVSTTLSPS